MATPQDADEPAAVADPREAAEDAGLVYVDDARPGFTRRRSGNGFGYRDVKGATVRDARTLARIRALAIPPAYTDVWICPSANGRLTPEEAAVLGLLRSQLAAKAETGTGASRPARESLAAAASSSKISSSKISSSKTGTSSKTTSAASITSPSRTSARRRRPSAGAGRAVAIAR